jgi:hypothetical protein
MVRGHWHGRQQVASDASRPIWKTRRRRASFRQKSVCRRHNSDTLDDPRSFGRIPTMRELGPRPTLGELQRATPWVWLWCERCRHHAPFACAVAVIRWGPDASSDKLRAGARCTSCGNKGATVQHPGWPAIILASVHFRRIFTTKADATMTVTPRMAIFTLIGTLAYLGLAVLGWGGPTAFFSHPPLIALTLITFLLSGSA